MSGGSYKYLCYAGAEELFENYWKYSEQVQRMTDRLSELGYAQDAARETLEVLLIMRQAMTNINTRVDRLAGVWKSIEWWDSADSGEDDVQRALKAYRGEKDDE